MKRNLGVLVLLFITFCITNCTKHAGRHRDNKEENITLDISLQRGELYQLDLSKYGDKDDIAEIQTQATEYSISEISTKTNAVTFMYNFSAPVNPKESTVKNETVIIRVYEPQGNNTHCHNEQTTITIHFKIQ